MLCDNLGGQTTDEFKNILLKHAGATVHALLAGNTDEIQVVDAGFGACIKRHKEQVESEWLEIDENWARWSGGRLTAGERRVLMTQWYGEAYERACNTFDFCKVFDNVGSNLTADGSRDHLIHLQGLKDFTFSMEDAKRDVATGEFVGDGAVSEAQHEVDTDDEREVYSDNEAVEGSAAEGSAAEGEGCDNDSDEDTDCISAEEGEVGEYEAPEGWEIIKEYKFQSQADIVGTHFAYKFTSGWDRGRVVGVEKRRSSPYFGLLICKFVSESCQRCLELHQDDYDVDDIWITIQKSK